MTGAEMVWVMSRFCTLEPHSIGIRLPLASVKENEYRSGSPMTSVSLNRLFLGSPGHSCLGAAFVGLTTIVKPTRVKRLSRKVDWAAGTATVRLLLTKSFAPAPSEHGRSFHCFWNAVVLPVKPEVTAGPVVTFTVMSAAFTASWVPVNAMGDTPWPGEQNGSDRHAVRPGLNWACTATSLVTAKHTACLSKPDTVMPLTGVVTPSRWHFVVGDVVAAEAAPATAMGMAAARMMERRLMLGAPVGGQGGEHR